LNSFGSKKQGHLLKELNDNPYHFPESFYFHKFFDEQLIFLPRAINYTSDNCKQVQHLKANLYHFLHLEYYQ